FSSRRRHTRLQGDWSSDVCSSDLPILQRMADLGILAWYLPEFGETLDLIPYDPSHDYTVGQHTLYVIRHLDSLRFAEGAEEMTRSEERRVGKECRCGRVW